MYFRFLLLLMLAAAQLLGSSPPTYRLFDKEKSAAYLRDAFAATATVAEEDGRNFRTRFQGEIVKRLAEVSVTDACAMLRAMAEPGKDGGSGSAARNVVDYLLAREKPDFDSRRAIVFGNALTAYKKRPEGTAFPELLAAHWRGLPADSARSAVADVVQAISDRVEDPGSNETAQSRGQPQGQGADRASFTWCGKSIPSAPKNCS